MAVRAVDALWPGARVCGGAAADDVDARAGDQRASAAPGRWRPPASELDRALAARDYERAARLLADAIARQPASRELLTQIASVFMMDRKPLNAAIALKKAEALGPLDNHARLQLALAYIAMKRGDWARPELERLAMAEPANVIYSYWLARLDYDAGQYASAIRRLQDVVAQAPAFARAHDNLGLCYEALNQPDEAIPHYREAVRLNRLDDKARSGWPALNLGILLRTRGELEEAEKLFREALTYDRALRARLLPARRAPGAARSHGRRGEGVAAGDLGRRRLCRAVLRVVTHLPATRSAPRRPTRR